MSILSRVKEYYSVENQMSRAKEKADKERITRETKLYELEKLRSERKQLQEKRLLQDNLRTEKEALRKAKYSGLYELRDRIKEKSSSLNREKARVKGKPKVMSGGGVFASGKGFQFGNSGTQNYFSQSGISPFMKQEKPKMKKRGIKKVIIYK